VIVASGAQDLCRLGAVRLRELLGKRELSARELVEALLRQITSVNDRVNALVTLDPDGAFAAAAKADEAAAHQAELPLLHGLPMAHKDLQDTAGLRTTYGSRVFAEHVPVADSPVVKRLKDAGAIRLGKSNTPEFGTGSQTYNAVFGATRNPYDLTRTPGGSSGGAAAALASCMVPLADGTDMGGSLRNPASFCNVVGLRPSFGMVSTGPTLTPWFTLGVTGPMARSVEDVGLLFAAMTGSPVRPVQSFDLRGRKAAFSATGGGLPVARDVEAVLRDSATAIFSGLGLHVEESVPDFEGADEIFRTLRARYYAEQYGEVYQRHSQDLNEDNRWQIEAGFQVTDEELNVARDSLAAFHDRIRAYFRRFDVLAMPVSQVAPFDVDVRWVREIEGVSMPTYLDWMRSAYLITVTGLPAVSVPCGFTPSGLPVGVQLVGRPGGDWELLRIAASFEALSAASGVLPGEQPNRSEHSLPPSGTC
jgi:amidase